MTRTATESVVSLDVESLFTAVHVADRMDIIDAIFMLLMIFTTQSPFNFDVLNHVHDEGVNMCSPLGPLLADFYVLRLVNKLLSEKLASNSR